MRSQFENRQVKKLYWAIVAGRPAPTQAVIQKPIAEVVAARKKAVISREGQQAITAYRVLQTAGDAGNEVSLIEARPKTGRLHQIRVHMASLGHPVLGEDTYARNIRLPHVPRLCLHAAELSFIHPTTGHRVTVQSPWPSDLNKTLKRFGLAPPSQDTRSTE
jgi:23S rRNA pseudouridine1911/1915/1917 synthase